MVVLNKIDGLWDELKTPEGNRSRNQGNSPIPVPVSSVCRSARSFPVSAQKGLVAKISGDAELLLRSRLPLLESALRKSSFRPNRISCATTPRPNSAKLAAGYAGCSNRALRDCASSSPNSPNCAENKGVVEYMMGKVRAEKDEFEAGLQRYYAVRSVFSTLTNRLFGHWASIPSSS